MFLFLFTVVSIGASILSKLQKQQQQKQKGKSYGHFTPKQRKKRSEYIDAQSKDMMTIVIEN